jgi:putative phage-type endonuclease
MIQTLKWTDEAEWLAKRRQYVTSTDIPILYGFRPYANSPTLEELWWEKKTGTPRAFKGNEATRGGKIYEASAARWIAEDRGLKLADLRQTFFFDDEKGWACSVDFGIVSPWKSLLEIKCLSEQVFRAKWLGGVSGFLLPQDKELQIQFQMMVTGIQEMLIGAAYCLTKKPAVAVRQANKSMARSMAARVGWFVKSLKDDRPPIIRQMEREPLPERAYA